MNREGQKTADEVNLQLSAAEGGQQGARRRETLKFYGGRSLVDFAEDLRVITAGFAQPFEVKDAEKVMKRWVAKGRKMQPPDLPPFQRPREMAAWWRRLQSVGVMGKRPPDWMTLLEQIDAPPPASSAKNDPTAAASTEASPPSSAQIDMPPDFEMPKLDARASNVEVQIYDFAQAWVREMEKAKASRDSARFFKAWNEYKQLANSLRAWQKDRDRERLRTGEVLEVVKEREALSVIFGSINKTFTAVLVALCERLAPQMSVLDRRAYVMPLRDKIFSALKGTRFETALTDEQIAELVPPLPS